MKQRNTVLSEDIFSAVKTKIMNDTSISDEARKNRLGELSIIRVIMGGKLSELDKKINESKDFDLRLYLDRLKIYFMIKRAYFGKDPLKFEYEWETSVSEIFKELKSVDNFINSIIDGTLTENKKD